MLLGLIAGLAVLDGCKGRKATPRTSWRDRLQKTLPNGSLPAAPLTDREMAKVVEAARSFTGTPYLTGGTTRGGIDCSGLVVMAYQSVNKPMPRISYQQAEAGTPVAEKELAPGDLIFFTDRKGNDRITHVGLITEIRDKETVKFIHTTNSLGVVENNLKQNYWHNLYLRGVRVR